MARTYTVIKGDSLGKIARGNGIVLGVVADSEPAADIELLHDKSGGLMGLPGEVHHDVDCVDERLHFEHL